MIFTAQVKQSNFARYSNRQAPQLSFKKINSHLVLQLSEREYKVLQLIYEGKANQQIADTIFISVNTIKKHINSAYSKLDVTTRTKAIARLLELMMK